MSDDVKQRAREALEGTSSGPWADAVWNDPYALVRDLLAALEETEALRAKRDELRAELKALQHVIDGLDPVLSHHITVAAAGAPMTDLTEVMTGDEYMALLLARQRDWMTAHPTYKLAPTLESFVRAEDVPDIELPEPTPRTQTVPPRRYRPASYWRGRVKHLTAQMAALSEPIITDRAAAGGVALGVRRTVRVAAREDRALAQYADLRKRLAHAERMLLKAEQREGNINDH